MVQGKSSSRLLLLALAVPYSLACSSTPELSLSATPGSIVGDGQSPITVTANVTVGGAPVDAATVHFVASAGSFSGTSGANPQITDVDASSGPAVATLTAPRTGRGRLTITATSSVNGTALTGTQTVALTPSGGLAASIQFSCSQQNIGALVTGRTDPIHVLCTATAHDVHGAAIPNASIETMAEAGVLAWQNDDAGNQILVYTVAPGATPPLDVPPLDSTGAPRPLCPVACQSDVTKCTGEPCWVDLQSVTHNPRDGVATLVVAVPGVSAFDDLGEPYVDANDNGIRDPTEAFLDFNGNGNYDKPDNTQKPRLVWKSLRIIWSGSADATPTRHGSYFDATATATTLSGTAHIWDTNFNALAADGAANTDTLQVTADCTEAGGNESPPLASVPPTLRQTTPGILFCDAGPACPGGIDGAGSSTTYRDGTDYRLTGTVAAKPTTCTFTAATSRQIDPGLPGNAGSASTQDTVTGSVNISAN